MGFKIPVISDVLDVIDTIGNVVDDFHDSDEEKRADAFKRLQLAFDKLKLVHQQLLGQQEINKIEAKHGSVFVAGWRPFIGWVGGFGIAYQFVGYPLLLWWWAAFGPDGTTAPPPLEATTLLTLVLSMLGVGTMRSFDKIKGVDTKRIKHR